MSAVESEPRVLPPQPDGEPLIIPAGVELVRDVVYGTGGGRALTMHLLRPRATPAEPMPMLLFLHGGGWRRGTKDSGLRHLVRFAERGYLCAAAEYRFSGEARFPAHLEDCKCAVRFLRHEAARLGGDPDHVGAWGISAGGHLATMLGTTAGIADFEGQGGWESASSDVQAVCDWYGQTDIARLIGEPRQIDTLASDSPESLLIGGPISEFPDRAARTSPLAYLRGGEPPFLILHGESDLVVPPSQSTILRNALDRAGVEVTLITLPGVGHGGPAFESPEITARFHGFFDRHLRPARSA